MDIKKIGIVGAGVMGGEIAFVATQAGFPVVLKDIELRFLDIGVANARQIYEFKVRRRRMSEDEMEQKLKLISVTLGYDELADADFIIEAVPENLDLKRRVFSELDAACSPGAILATNTSALSVSAIAEAVSRPERVAGMHFFNPVSMMRLVEVVRGARTSDEAMSSVCALAEAIGKSPVRCADSAGFIVNRLLCAAMLEAARCEREGLMSRADIDSALVKPDAGLPVGLFKMADQLGIDLIHKVMRILQDAFGDRFAPPEEVERLIASGHLGVKSGKGFYDYGKS
ncbi:MAG TPA: 3-hydroxyacyl-CoA dehydrogenase family protein [bacterium]|nr:3-hydroxyacyl-CoA dehydrogenase family protein [bacterium]